MTPDQIIKALDKYLAFYAEGDVTPGPAMTPDQIPPGEKMPTEEGAIQHVLWMCREAKTFAAEKPEKAMRWLCFVQGVLWSVDGWTIDEFKDDNR
jgi:hypothetical protein